MAWVSGTASTLTSSASIVHDAAAYYDRVALDNVKKILMFATLTTPKRLPKKSGLVHQMFRYIPFAANTTAGSQGAIGTPITPTTETVSATIAQYVDFINNSDVMDLTIIDDYLTNQSEEMGYRAGLTVDTLIRTEFDSGSATTSTALVGSNLGANDFRKMSSLLRGTDISPAVGSDFLSLSHPYVQYDLISETATGGFVDVTKYTSERNAALFEGNELGKINGVRLGSSTNVGTSGAGATTKYWVYVVGKGAVAAVNLADSNVGTPGSGRPEITVLNHDKDKVDPAGVIKSSISYNFLFVAKRLKSTSDTERYQQTPADSSIAS